jgi:hypothetical protein
MAGEDRLDLKKGNLLGDRILKFAPIRDIQEIQEIPIDYQLHLNRPILGNPIFSGRKVLKKLAHFVIKKEILMGVEAALKKAPGREMTVRDHDFVALHTLSIP